MSIIEQLAQLEATLQELNQKSRRLAQENQSLKNQCNALTQKNDAAKKKVANILNQLTKMEPNDA